MADVLYVNDDFSNDRILNGSVCCFGVFDGVHAGHRYLVEHTVKDAKRCGSRSAIITFDIDPDELFHAASLKKLMSNTARIEMLASLPVDDVIVLAFTREFASRAPEEFLEACFGAATPTALHVGSNFRFGSHATGDVEALSVWGESHGMRVEGHDLETMLDQAVSSTRIRELLGDGQRIKEANELLTRPYRMTGKVEAGRQEGRDMGFRTANVYIDPQLRALSPGVFAAYAFVDGIRYKAAVSVGVSPMFADETNAYCEAHLLDFDRDIYGNDITLDFIYWLRPMMKFDSVDALVATVMGNIQWVRDNL